MRHSFINNEKNQPPSQPLKRLIINFIAFQIDILSSLSVKALRTWKSFKSFFYHKRLLVTEYPLVDLGSSICAQSDQSWQIPGQVFQIWKCKSFGKTHAATICAFRQRNPSLSFYLYNHIEADAYLREVWSSHPIYRVYSGAKFRTLRADIFRYCILYEKGGYYFDIDCCVSVSLRSLHKKSESRLLTYEETAASFLPSLETMGLYLRPELNLAMWGFGFAPHDPILLKVIDNIVKYYPFFKNKVFPDVKQAILLFTGPGMFTKSVREHVDSCGNLGGMQTDISFNQNGITWIPKSEVRFNQAPSYVTFKNSIIVE
jgi:mannosyltransferase OCH1-like enzyme